MSTEKAHTLKRKEEIEIMKTLLNAAFIMLIADGITTLWFIAASGGVTYELNPIIKYLSIQYSPIFAIVITRFVGWCAGVYLKPTILKTEGWQIYLAGIPLLYLSIVVTLNVVSIMYLYV